MSKFKKVEYQGGNEISGGGPLADFFTGRMFDEDYVGNLTNSSDWDGWFKKIQKRHKNLSVFSKKDPRYVKDQDIIAENLEIEDKDDHLDPYSNFIMPDLIDNYDFGTIINVFSDYYNFENRKWKTYKGENIGKIFKEDNITVPLTLPKGRVIKVMKELIAYLEKSLKEGKGDAESINYGIREIKLAFEKPPFKTFANRLGLSSNQNDEKEKQEEQIKSKEQKEKEKLEEKKRKEEEKKRKELMKLESKEMKKTNQDILSEVKKIRGEIEALSKQLQKVSLEANVPKEVKKRDIKLENKMKADRIREEINDLVKQEEAISKELFSTHVSRAKILFRDYI